MVMFGRWRTKNQKLTVFTYIMMIVCYKTNLKASKKWSFALPNIQLTLKILKESFKYMGKTDAKYNSISTPSEVTGLGLFVQLPKIYSETEYKNQNAQN